jgi:Uma2 family endonuclease
MSMPALPKTRMKVPEFLAWTQRQPEGRNYELVDGEIIAMAGDNVRHNLVKLAIARALEDALRVARLPCTVFTDGVSVAINDETLRIPDASVQCEVPPDLNSTIIEAPLIVVEVVSPSSERDDIETKLIDYFSVASIRHYLIVFSEKRVVLHHQRNERGALDTRIAHPGDDIALNPPGITVSVAALLGPLPAGGASVEAGR